MRVHELAAEGRAIAARLRRPARGEVHEQGVVAWADGIARDIDRLMNALAASADARDAEVRSGTMSLRRKRGCVIVEGRVIHAGNLFKAPA